MAGVGMALRTVLCCRISRDRCMARIRMIGRSCARVTRPDQANRILVSSAGESSARVRVSIFVQWGPAVTDAVQPVTDAPTLALKSQVIAWPGLSSEVIADGGLISSCT
jgi:hypothetical protein